MARTNLGGRRQALLGFACLVLVVVSPAGRLVERATDRHLMGMHRRWLAHRTTRLDRWQCHLLYVCIVAAGRLRYPEAAAILAHYIGGSGRPLQLPPDYLRRSPVVRDALVTLRVGQTRVVTLHQSQDWRLSYALNPFRLRREPHRVVLYQWMAFDPRPAARTVLNLGLLRFTVPDGLVHVLKPRPFKVYSEWPVENH